MGYSVVCNGALWNTINYPLKEYLFRGLNGTWTKNFKIW